MSQATAANATIKNTNHWSTRQLVTMALMCAIAALLSFVQIPILPAAPFLTYDPSLMPAMVCGFAFGPGAGFAVGAVAAIIHSLMLGEWVGGLMNICATLFFVVPAAAIYARKHTFAGAIIGLLVGCVVATIGAVAALLSFVQIPILPAAPFLTYDPSLMPAMVCGFAFGPGAGFAVGAVAAIIHSLMLGEWVGGLMNICATLFFVVPAAAIYARKHTFAGAIIGLLVGCVVATIGAVAANLTIGVWFWYGSADVIMPLILPAVLPFNLIKTVLNSALTLLVYKAISNLITPKKDQVKGR